MTSDERTVAYDLLTNAVELDIQAADRWLLKLQGKRPLRLVN